MIDKLLSQKKWIIGVYMLLAVAASIQSYADKPKTYLEGGIEYPRYNNYTIFKQSFHHLQNNQDLYILYPQEHWDLYKYTPSFSVFFGLFSLLPDWLGLTLWNLLNALILLLAVYYLPRFSLRQKNVILLLLAVELMTSLQHEQSNALIAGMLVFTFGLLERGKWWWASFCVVATAFIKLFGVVGFALFLFYPNKGKALGGVVFWTIFFLLLPLLFVSVEQYTFLYQSYMGLLLDDHSISYGYSVMGWLQSWFAYSPDKNAIVAVGVLLYLLPFLKVKLWSDYRFKYLLLCSTLIWIVIFNHKAESPTFIIAMTGVVLWYMGSPKSTLNLILLVSALVLTSLSPTDIFPRYLRTEWVTPYVLKAVPCILIWLKIIYDMLQLQAPNPDQELQYNTPRPLP